MGLLLYHVNSLELQQNDIFLVSHVLLVLVVWHCTNLTSLQLPMVTILELLWIGMDCDLAASMSPIVDES